MSEWSCPPGPGEERVGEGEGGDGGFRASIGGGFFFAGVGGEGFITRRGDGDFTGGGFFVGGGCTGGFLDGVGMGGMLEEGVGMVEHDHHTFRYLTTPALHQHQ